MYKMDDMGLYLSRQEAVIEGENESMNQHRDCSYYRCWLADETVMLMYINCR